MGKHTPGPWFQSHRKSVYGGYRTEIYTEDGEVVATAAWYPRKLNETTTTTDRAANAGLIAAAPDLLEAGSAALPFIAYAYSQGIAGAEEAGLAIEAAIAKATSP